jgi:hypothetical protein
MVAVDVTANVSARLASATTLALDRACTPVRITNPTMGSMAINSSRPRTDLNQPTRSVEPTPARPERRAASAAVARVTRTP